jgi:hypothetical protein
MKKPAALREYLTNSIPTIKNNPEQLQIFIDTGNLQARLETNLNFEYQYTLNLIMTDLAIHPNSVIVPLLAWLKHAQPDIRPDAIKFESEIISHDQIDLSITLPLTERVLVEQNEEGNFTTDHAGEPVPEWNLPDPATFVALFAKNELMTAGATNE